MARVAGGSIDFDLVIVGVDESRKEVANALKSLESVAQQTRDKIASAWGSGIEKIKFGFDLVKSAVSSIQKTVAAFADRMGQAVSAARDMGVGIDQAQRAMKFAEISGISLKEAIEKVGASSAEAEAAQKDNAKAMLEWKMLSSDLYDIMVDIGGSLLKSIAPAFPTIVAGAKVLGDIFTNYIAPAIAKVVNIVLNIRPIFGELGNILLASFELAGTAIINEFKNWFGYFEKIGVAAVMGVMNLFTDMWASAASLLAGTAAGNKMLTKEMRDKRDFMVYQEIARREFKGERVGDAERQQINREMSRQVIEQSAISTTSGRASAVSNLGKQIEQERADRDAQTAAKWQESSDRIADAAAKLSELVSTPPTDSQWDARLAEYLEAAMTPAEVAAPVAQVMKTEAPGRSAIMGSFSSFGISQRGGGASEPQQQSVDLLRMINSGIMQLIRVAGGSLIAVSSGNPTRAELGAQ
jgi:ribosomal protein L17